MSDPRWSGSPDRAARYAARFAALAADGADVHGEGDPLRRFAPDRWSRTRRRLRYPGRVAIRLAELGYECVGVDSDPDMLARAEAASSSVQWVLGDLGDRPARDHGSFDLVIAAGNVIPLVRPDTEAEVVAGLAAALAPRALLVTGFGLDAAHLPLAAAPFGLAEYDAWCTAAGLTLTRRWAGWDRSPYGGGGYAVSVHRHAGGTDQSNRLN